MKKGLTSGIVLLILGSVCGFLLALVNSFTAPIIAENELKAKIEALTVVYPNINSFDVEEIVLDGGIDTVYLLKDKTTQSVEAAIYSVSAPGYKNVNVEMLIAVEKNLSVVGYRLLSNSGTEGLGLDLQSISFGMKDGALINQIETKFDSYAGATKTSDGVKACFELVAARVSTDLGGAK